MYKYYMTDLIIFSEHWVGLQKQADGFYHWVDSTSTVMGYENFGGKLFIAHCEHSLS